LPSRRPLPRRRRHRLRLRLAARLLLGSCLLSRWAGGLRCRSGWWPFV